LQNSPEYEGRVISPHAHRILLIAALVLPVAIVIVVAAARLLTAMQDDAGALALERVGLALGIVWAIVLVCLVLVMGLAAVLPPSGRDRED
jgi:hypothetical protein